LSVSCPLPAIIVDLTLATTLSTCASHSQAAIAKVDALQQYCQQHIGMLAGLAQASMLACQ
jgi:hypothetical protein